MKSKTKEAKEVKSEGVPSQTPMKEEQWIPIEINLGLLRDKFFTDPDWKMMEQLIRSYIEPLLDWNTLDLKAPAEHVKAEVIGRMRSYNAMAKFLRDTQIISRPLREIKNPFQ